MSNPKYICLNGKIVPYQDANIHVMSPAVKYGASVFEGVRAYWNDDDKQLYVFRLAEHLKRLCNSRKVIQIGGELSDKVLTDALFELVYSNKFREDIHIRIFSYVDGFGEQAATDPSGYSIAALAKPKDARTTVGIKCTISSWIRLADTTMPPRIKCSANYINSRLARLQARADGYHDAILLNNRGKVSECTGACIFMVQNGSLVTPDVTSDILEGITRDTVIQLCARLGIPIAERSIDRTEMYLADEAFLAGSLAELIPIVRVDGHDLGSGKPGPFTQKLQAAYSSTVRGLTPVNAKWRTPVYDKAHAAA